jgi:glucosamine--fructose-6-phosphate aminotransferase (isomerizing)
MCGIIGVTGSADPLSLLLEGLARLEYRGYDSAGVALAGGDAVWRTRAATSTTSLATLTAAVQGAPTGAHAGIGHTRWATHGAPTEPNAHPHVDCTGKLALVHNGIVENYRELGEPLYAAGHVRTSETDTEVLAHIVEEEMASGASLAEALRRCMRSVRGDFSVAAVHADEPEVIVAARRTSPLILGRAGSTAFVASDVAALVGVADEFWQVDDDQIAEFRGGVLTVRDLDGNEVAARSIEVSWDVEAAQKGGYPDFMSKEMHEQPRAVADTLLGRLVRPAPPAPTTIDLEELTLGADVLAGVERVVLVACGSSYNAALVGRHALETWARVPADVDIASEFRYRNPVLDDRTLLVAVSQSGESLDTYHAMSEGRRRGARTVALTNVVDSLMARDADGVLYTRAGPEVGVASTKCHLAQLALLDTFALHFAQVRGTLPADELGAIAAELAGAPDQIAAMLDRWEEYAGVARRFAEVEDFYFLGRHAGHPVAMEGALKLKELAYVRAEAYAAGEMKHGPIALIEPGAVVVVVATPGPVYDKTMANVSEMKARGATVVLLAAEGDERAAAEGDAVLSIPAVSPLVTPLLAVVPLQVFAYTVASCRGLDVDRPRNLAKVVTVE